MPAESVSSPEQALYFAVLRFDRVEPDRAQIARLVHLRPGRDAHQRWFELIDTLLADSRRLLRPRGLVRIDDVVTLERRRVVLSSGAVFEGAVGTFLKHATQVATFVVTIGSALERLSRAWLRAGRVMQGTIADAIASESVEAAGARLGEVVRAWAQARGRDVTPPYSPGYCGMTVRQQVPLFSTLPVTRMINVRLTPSCLMVPVKSISGLIGIGPAEHVQPGGYPCAACDHPDCMQRRAPADRERLRCADWSHEEL